MDNGPSSYCAFDAKLMAEQLISKQVETPFQLSQRNDYATPGTPLSNNSLLTILYWLMAMAQYSK